MKNRTYVNFSLFLCFFTYSFTAVFSTQINCNSENEQNMYNLTSQDMAIKLYSSNILEECRIIFDKTFDNFKSSPNFTIKNDGSLVSDIEKSIEYNIGIFLKQKTSWAAFQGEEGYSHNAIQESSTYKWYIDPIDGTISFKNGLDSFALTLTLVNSYDPIATLIYFPKKGDIFMAFKGKGAFHNGKRICISNDKPSRHHIIAHSDLYAFEYLKRKTFLTTVQEMDFIPRTYTDIFAYTLVAKGECLAKVDAAAALWDLFPGFLIIREAGGEFIFYAADNPTEDLFGSCVAGHPQVVDQISFSINNKYNNIGAKMYHNKIPSFKDLREK